MPDPRGVQDEDRHTVASQLEGGREAAVPGANDRHVDAIRQRRHGRRRRRRGLPPVRGILEVGRKDLCGSHHSTSTRRPDIAADHHLVRLRSHREFWHTTEPRGTSRITRRREPSLGTFTLLYTAHAGPSRAPDIMLNERAAGPGITKGRGRTGSPERRAR